MSVVNMLPNGAGMRYVKGSVTTTTTLQTVSTGKTPTLVIVYGTATSGNVQRYVGFPKDSMTLYEYGSDIKDSSDYISITTGGFQIKGFNSGNIGTLTYYAVFDEFE